VKTLYGPVVFIRYAYFFRGREQPFDFMLSGFIDILDPEAWFTFRPAQML
jgi:hypothetical protein